MFWSRGKVSFDDAGDRDSKGADARERGRLKSSDTPDIRNQMRSSFIAKGEGSFIDQERRSGRRVSSATRAGSGGDDVVSEGVESKHPELMI